MVYDVIIIGAGAAGLMAAATAGKRGRRVLLLELSDTIGEKIRISGGGRCNFTNIHATSANYICSNPHFPKSALSSYTQHDFIKLVESYGIAYHEKTLGQLFCDGSSKQIIEMLLDQCHQSGVTIQKNCRVSKVEKPDRYRLSTSMGSYDSESLVIATGGLSIPKMGATDFAHRIARQFGLSIIPPRPALVPLMVAEPQQRILKNLSGVSHYARVSYEKAQFLENILFTHRGLSGPAILQISSYMPSFDRQEIIIDLFPTLDIAEIFIAEKNSKQALSTLLKQYLTNRFVDYLAMNPDFSQKMTDLKKSTLMDIAAGLHRFVLPIAGSEGYAKAEVTVGGVDTEMLSSKTMGSKALPSLYFVGEAVDVTGWLGGYNFQWAWSSGYAAGRFC